MGETCGAPSENSSAENPWGTEGYSRVEWWDSAANEMRSGCIRDSELSECAVSPSTQWDYAVTGYIGKTTEECMRSGIVYGTAAMLDGLIDRIREEFPGKTVNIVATGGSAPFIVKFCRNKILYDNTLLMKGLWAIYKRNQ